MVWLQISILVFFHKKNVGGMLIHCQAPAPLTSIMFFVQHVTSEKVLLTGSWSGPGLNRTAIKDTWGHSSGSLNMNWVADDTWGLLLISLRVVMAVSHAGECPFLDDHAEVFRGKGSCCLQFYSKIAQANEWVHTYRSAKQGKFNKY